MPVDFSQFMDSGKKLSIAPEALQATSVRQVDKGKWVVDIIFVGIAFPSKPVTNEPAAENLARDIWKSVEDYKRSL